MSLDENALKSIARTQLSAPCGKSAMSDFGAVIGLSIENAKVFEDISFAWAKRFTIPDADFVDIVFDPTDVPAGKVLVVLPTVFKAYQAGPINIDLYIGTNADDNGVLWTGLNRDNRSSTQPDMKIRFEPTINDIGTKTPAEFVIFSNGTPAIATLGGESKDAFIFVANTTFKYTFRLTNVDSTDALAHMTANIYEVPEVT